MGLKGHFFAAAGLYATSAATGAVGVMALLGLSPVAAPLSLTALAASVLSADLATWQSDKLIRKSVVKAKESLKKRFRPGTPNPH